MVSRPVLDVLDLLERRWALRLTWELRRDALTFSQLRKRTGVSPSVLSQRLRDLDDAGVIDRHRDGRYRLSGAGRELARILYELNRWAETTAVERLVPTGARSKSQPSGG
jgi:DNA-binding HxlR family transcriptional regulator